MVGRGGAGGGWRACGGVDQTAGMLTKSRATAAALGLDQVEFREGLAESLPVEDGWADVVISNGVINLCADKRAVFDEVRRVLRQGGSSGKRLDFLMQELNREANTLGSKSVDAELSQVAPEPKVLHEPMREQRQNIE